MGSGITSVTGSDPALLLLRVKHLIARGTLVILCSGYSSGISQTHCPFRQVRMPPEPGRPQGLGRQLAPQAPQFSIVDKSLSQPLLRSLSQSPKPAVQMKAHVPLSHVRIALSGATQALLQQTLSTQNPELHWFGVSVEQVSPSDRLGWHTPRWHQLPLTQWSSLPQVSRQAVPSALHLKSPQLS